MPEAQTPGTLTPTQEHVAFLLAYVNVYANVSTGALELGARIYRSVAAADERRRTHPVRSTLTFVATLPLSVACAESLRTAALTTVRAEQERRRAAEEATAAAHRQDEARRLAQETLSEDEGLDDDNNG